MVQLSEAMEWPVLRAGPPCAAVVILVFVTARFGYFFVRAYGGEGADSRLTLYIPVHIPGAKYVCMFVCMCSNQDLAIRFYSQTTTQPQSKRIARVLDMPI